MHVASAAVECSIIVAGFAKEFDEDEEEEEEEVALASYMCTPIAKAVAPVAMEHAVLPGTFLGAEGGAGDGFPG